MGIARTAYVNGECRCNEDFAREYHQLFFGILGAYNPAYHEGISIKNTAAALTGILVERNFKGDLTDNIELHPEWHYPDSLEILNVSIGGHDTLQRINQLSQYAIEHPESLDNLPVRIIRDLGDDNLTPDKMSVIRSAWRAMPEKNLLDFLRAYAISVHFHSDQRIKYLTSVDRHLLIANKIALNDEENYLDIYLDIYDEQGKPDYFHVEDVQIFRPRHNVFGGQTGVEAADSATVFRNNYNFFTGGPGGEPQSLRDADTLWS